MSSKEFKSNSGSSTLVLTSNRLINDIAEWWAFLNSEQGPKRSGLSFLLNNSYFGHFVHYVTMQSRGEDEVSWYHVDNWFHTGILDKHIMDTLFRPWNNTAVQNTEVDHDREWRQLTQSLFANEGQMWQFSNWAQTLIVTSLKRIKCNSLLALAPKLSVIWTLSGFRLLWNLNYQNLCQNHHFVFSSLSGATIYYPSITSWLASTVII